jgi:Tol biopolymer transport system component
MADGRRISFDSRPNAQAHIFTVDAKGGTPVQVTSDGSEQLVASSSVDGRWIYFSSNLNGSWQVWKIRPGTSEMVQVTTNGGFAPLESPDGRYVYYAKARTLPGLWRVPVGGGTEELVLETLKQGYWGYWAVTEVGIYYVDKPSDAENAGIYFYSFATKQSARVMQMDKPPKYGSSAFCISPDRRFIAYAQVDQSGSDIMLVDSSKSFE